MRARAISTRRWPALALAAALAGAVLPATAAGPAGGTVAAPGPAASAAGAQPQAAAASAAQASLANRTGASRRAGKVARAAALDAMRPRPLASIQELMQSIIDPSADALWESVSTTVTAAGTEDKRPLTDADWQEVRHLAVRLSEGARLLADRGRVVAHPGQRLEDEHVSAVLTSAQIQRKIAADPARFASHAAVLQDAAQESLRAIDARNVAGMLRAGSRLDHACEACHRVYWYPRDQRPGVPD